MGSKTLNSPPKLHPEPAALLGERWEFGADRAVAGRRRTAGRKPEVGRGEWGTICSCVRSGSGFAPDGLSRPRGLLLPRFYPFFCLSGTANVETVTGTRVRTSPVSRVEPRTGSRCVNLAVMALGSDIFVRQWRPCLISPQAEGLRAGVCLAPTRLLVRCSLNDSSVESSPPHSPELFGEFLTGGSSCDVIHMDGRHRCVTLRLRTDI